MNPFDKLRSERAERAEALANNDCGNGWLTHEQHEKAAIRHKWLK